MLFRSSNERISDPSYEGVRKEIDKINRNIEAISAAMLQGALLDKNYRDQVIDDMRKDLVEKGKDRSNGGGNVRRNAAQGQRSLQMQVLEPLHERTQKRRRGNPGRGRTTIPGGSL